MLSYIKVYKDFINIARELDNGARGRLFMAILQYANDEEVSDLTGGEKIAFLMMKSQIDRDRDAYKEVSEKRKTAGQKGAKKRWEQEEDKANAISPMANDSKNSKCHQDKDKEEDKEEDKDKEEEEGISPPIIPQKGDEPPKDNKRMTRPTLSEVQEYCKQRKNKVDAQRFWDYYESNGWKVGKNPMKDWKAAVRTWERPTPTKEKPSNGIRVQRDYDAILAAAEKRAAQIGKRKDDYEN